MAELNHIPIGTEVGCAETHRLRVEDLHVHYGSICALHDVTFELPCGHALALIGRNGAGKSTLLKAIAGLQTQVVGRISWKNDPVSRASHEIAYLPQRDQVDWNFPITVQGLIETGRYPQLGLWRRFSKHDAEVVDFAIETMELGDLRKRQLRQLSGGQQQRAFIGRAVAQEAHVLLLDEPFAGLDKPSTEKLTDLCRQLVTEGRLIVASHHDLKTVHLCFDDALLLNGGQVAFGPATEVLNDESIRLAYAA